MKEKEIINLLKAAGLPARGTTLGVLDYGLIQKGKLYCTDLERWLICDIDAPDGIIYLDMFKKGGGVPLSLTTNSFTHDDYPAVPELPDLMEIPLEMFDNIGDFDGYQAVSNDAREALKGVNVDLSTGGIYATQGHILLYRSFYLDPIDTYDKSIIFPAQALKLMKKVKLDKVEFNDKHIKFSFPGGMYVCGLMEGPYPNYMQLIPQETKHTFSIKKALWEELKSIGPFIDKGEEGNRQLIFDKSGEIKFSVKDEKKSIFSKNFIFNDGPIAFNYGYLSFALGKLGDAELHYNSRQGAFLYRGQGEARVVMPLRVLDDEG